MCNQTKKTVFIVRIKRRPWLPSFRVLARNKDEVVGVIKLLARSGTLKDGREVRLSERSMIIHTLSEAGMRRRRAAESLAVAIGIEKSQKKRRVTKEIGGDLVVGAEVLLRINHPNYNDDHCRGIIRHRDEITGLVEVQHTDGCVYRYAFRRDPWDSTPLALTLVPPMHEPLQPAPV